MTITGTELLSMTVEELLDRYQPSKCAKCNVTLHESTTGCRFIGGDCVCSDCYFHSMSDELDRHPICVPRRR